MCRTVLTRPDHRATDDDLRQRLLDAAAGLLDDSGIEAVTIRETARRCGVSHGAPRRHFPSRTSLLGHLANARRRRTGRRTRRHRRDAAPARPRLRRVRGAPAARLRPAPAARPARGLRRRPAPEIRAGLNSGR
ncbi:TetR/AcrR family transcriptional regulator [Actinoallomurus sp. CA-142502]|uniref:TetR/AcrR family transcriptional regulator n=1 Tax=Actinoallomurus sp. CA-142502 TaxID=3239885 RepID=UPI003D926AAA